MSQAVMNPTNTVFDVKRLIGRSFNDEAVQGDITHWPFTVINSDGKPMIEVEYRSKTRKFYAEQISSMVLSRMEETAEVYLDKKVTDAVITVPAHFNINQRLATIDAGRIAGLKVLRLINEPTAAAIAYGMDKAFDRQRNVLIFDWGGGTFDVSILSIENGRIEVKAVDGDTHLGGEDIDSRLVDHFAKRFKMEHEGMDLTSSKKAISRLRRACEKAKRSLSSAEYTYMDVDALLEGIDLRVILTRAQLEELCLDLFNRTMDAVRRALGDAKMEKDDVHEVVLVGGSTRIPKVQQLLQEFFDGIKLKKSVNPDEVVAYGAALLAANLTGQRSAKTQDLVLLEVTPLSLGLEDPDGTMTTVIKRNTPIPTKQIWGRQTAGDYQTAVTFKIFEGERARTRDNYLLGSCRLTGITPAPRGETKFDVVFKIDENGILHVSAVERSTEKQKCITITNYRGRLSEKEVEQMLRDAERCKQEDEEERRRMAAMNALVDYIYSIKRKLEREEVKQKTSEEYRKGMLAMCEETIKRTETRTQTTKENYEEMLRKFASECSLIVGVTNPGS